MNISAFGQSTFSGSKSSGVIYAGNLLTTRKSGLKSTQDKLERQQQTQNQINFFTNQKENLKNMQCDTVEEIARKLDMLHAYDDQIAAVKNQYNNEQMFHIMDEARELGEKIAKAVEKNAPKTAEERKEEMVEEALGLDENEGLLDDMLEEAAKMQKELQDELLKDTVGELEESILEETDLDAVSVEQTIEEDIQENFEETVYEKIAADTPLEELNTEQYLAKAEELKRLYRPMDILI